MRRFFITQNTEGTKRKPEVKKPQRIFSVRSVFSVGNMYFDCDGQRGWQPCS